MKLIEILKAILFGIIEGITEWLPISSTGHMIILDELVKLNVSDAFMEMFLVVIQLGAILAVPTVFFDKLNPFSKNKSEADKKATISLYFKVIIGAVPAAILGVLLDDIMDAYLYTYHVVSIALIVYGIAFIVVEYLNNKKNASPRVDSVYSFTYKDAITVGLFQTLSLIPGTSRSGSTILGGIMTGISRTAAAEFSFYMAIPIMVGASGLKILKLVLSGVAVTGFEILLLILGMAVAYVVSVLIIKLLMEFVKKHSFSAFGIYRIALGALVLIFFALR